MDWNAAIEKNREALKRVLAALVAMAGLGGAAAFTSPLRGFEARSSDRASGSIVGREGRDAAAGSGDPAESRSEGRQTLPRHLHRAVLRLLRPAESAARRLVIVAARGLVVNLPPPRPRKAKQASTIPRNGVGTGILMPCRALPGSAGSARPPAAPRPVCLPLFDPLYQPYRLRRATGSGVPRICFPGYRQPYPVAPRLPISPRDPIDAGRLHLRLAALAAALDDLPRHGRRFARWQARRAEVRRDAAGAQNQESFAQGQEHSGRRRARRISPLRPGRPPGAPRRPVHEVHDILDVVHGLAFWALHPDTS